MTGVVRFLSLKRKLGWDKDSVKCRYSCYTCRHTFAHRMLSGYWNQGAGCSIETLAELIGNTPKVAFDHYGKEWGQHYQEPLWAAIGEPGKGQRDSKQPVPRKTQGSGGANAPVAAPARGRVRGAVTAKPGTRKPR